MGRTTLPNQSESSSGFCNGGAVRPDCCGCSWSCDRNFMDDRHPRALVDLRAPPTDVHTQQTVWHHSDSRLRWLPLPVLIHDFRRQLVMTGVMGSCVFLMVCTTGLRFRLCGCSD